jgi:hypothetical protein
MKCRYCLEVALTASMILGSPPIAISQNASRTTPNKPPVLPSAGTQTQEFRPGLDDLMTMLIQPRHTRLYYAGTNKNWELAASEVRDLRAAFSRIAQFIPKYLGVGVDGAVGAIMAPKLQSVDAAISSADSKQFAEAYANLTLACNACHAYMEHPYLVIKIPIAASDSMYGDQDFSAETSQSKVVE